MIDVVRDSIIGKPANDIVALGSPTPSENGDISVHSDGSHSSSHISANNSKEEAALRKEANLKVRDDLGLVWDEGSKARTVDIAAFGVMITFASIAYGWNTILIYGFGTWLIALATMSFAYVGALNCVGEIMSDMPFNGGSYGLARVFIGFYPGFMVGSFQWMQAIVYASVNIQYCAQMIVQYKNWPNEAQIPLFFLFFGFFCLTALAKGRWYFNVNLFLTFSCIVYMCIYLFGATKYMSFHDNAPFVPWDDGMGNTADANVTNSTTASMPPLDYASLGRWFIGGPRGYMTCLAAGAYPYAGQESAMFLTAIAKDPKTTIPRGLTYGVYANICIAIVIVFVACSLPPGTYQLSSLDFPMDPAFNYAFNTDDTISSSYMVPFLFAAGMTLFLPAVLLTYSLAESGLAPAIFKHDRYGLAISLLANSVIGLGVCLIIYFAPEIYEDTENPLFIQMMFMNIGFLGGATSMISDILAFLRLRYQFRDTKRDFTNPFGVVGALLAIGCFVVGMIGSAFYQNDKYVAIVGFLLIWFLLSVYYLFVKDHQSLSKVEMKCVFKLHVALNNKRRQRKTKKDANSKNFLRNMSKERSNANSNMEKSINKSDSTPLSARSMPSGRLFKPSFKILNVARIGPSESCNVSGGSIACSDKPEADVGVIVETKQSI